VKRKHRQKVSANEDAGTASDSGGGEGDPPENIPSHQPPSPEPSAAPPRTKRKKKTPSKSGKKSKVTMKVNGSSAENAEGGPMEPASLDQTPESEAKKKRLRPKPKLRFSKVAFAEDGPSLEEGTSSTKALTVSPVDAEITTEQSVPVPVPVPSVPNPVPTAHPKTIRRKGKKSAASATVSGSLVPEDETVEAPWPRTAAPRPRTRSARRAAPVATASMSSAVAQWEVQGPEGNLLGRVSSARAISSPPAVLPSLESNSGVAIEEVEEQEESEEVQAPIAISGGLAPLPAGSVMLSTPGGGSALHGLAEAAAGAPTDPNEIPGMSRAFGHPFWHLPLPLHFTRNQRTRR
jgi:hypothetical protein